VLKLLDACHFDDLSPRRHRPPLTPSGFRR
jgi:hypothetical protein